MVEPVTGELPGLLRRLANPPPLVRELGAMPLGAVLTRAVRDLARRRPEIFSRLNEHRTRSFVIAPTDLGLSFRMVPNGVRATVAVSARGQFEGDVHVRGPILALLGLLDGTLDGDALFFDRTIAVSGRTDALLALRNAIEDAELKPSDLLGLSGGLGRVADFRVPKVLSKLRRMAGMPLDEVTP
ncbi:lipid carrier [Stappia sp. F7233]|uniref:Lipid carrier n=1 Tax=Stappia albiluteola TaxID=2758565 RepID=A0A839A9R9_9HYPH|nr:lipid carrier [Stappia albiluteola]MBA5775692.1 lipid carrier [Stappia albiluteola]